MAEPARTRLGFGCALGGPRPEGIRLTIHRDDGLAEDREMRDVEDDAAPSPAGFLADRSPGADRSRRGCVVLDMTRSFRCPISLAGCDARAASSLDLLRNCDVGAGRQSPAYTE